MRRRGDWIETYSGVQFWPLDPDPDEIELEDIAHALAMKCRFTGHCHEFYSVAQHSVLVSCWVPEGDALWGLMHDAAEAYLPDVSRPIKPLLVGFDLIEEQIMRAVAVRFGLKWPEPTSIGLADAAAVLAERREFMYPSGRDWGIRVEPLPVTIDSLPPASAENAFLARFRELTGGAA